MINQPQSAASSESKEAGIVLHESPSTESGNFMEDPTLARLLSRLAAIQGKPVAAFRFGMTLKTDAGVVIHDLPRRDRAAELWNIHFPQGHARGLSIAKLQRTDFPVLWVSSDEQQVLILRGPLTQGGVSGGR